MDPEGHDVPNEDGDEADEEPDAFEDEPRRENLPDHQMPPQNRRGEHRTKQP